MSGGVLVETLSQRWAGVKGKTRRFCVYTSGGKRTCVGCGS